MDVFPSGSSGGKLSLSGQYWDLALTPEDGLLWLRR